MKRDPDCIRAVMLKIEELQQYTLDGDGCIENHGLYLEELCEALPKYKKEDIFYSLDLMEQAEYISLSTQWFNNVLGHCAVNYMTFYGHEFLDSIRDSKRWKTIKSGLSSVRNFSLSAMSSIAEGVTSAAIDAYLEGRL